MPICSGEVHHYFKSSTWFRVYHFHQSYHSCQINTSPRAPSQARRQQIPRCKNVEVGYIRYAIYAPSHVTCRFQSSLHQCLSQLPCRNKLPRHRTPAFPFIVLLNCNTTSIFISELRHGQYFHALPRSTKVLDSDIAPPYIPIGFERHVILRCAF